MKLSEMRVHPLAERFPMLDAEALAELAESIRLDGLNHPIVVTPDGVLLDGRNRLAACELIGMTPETVVYEGDDPFGFVLRENVHRRHMTKGQLAMAVALGLKSFAAKLSGGQTAAAQAAGVSKPRLSYAMAVIDYAPELCDAVLSGEMPLDAAYRTAQERKAEQESRGQAVERERKKLAALRERAPDLADQVTEERLSLAEAEGAWMARKVELDEFERMGRAAAEVAVSHYRTDVSAILAAIKMGVPPPFDPAVLIELEDLLNLLKEHWRGDPPPPGTTSKRRRKDTTP